MFYPKIKPHMSPSALDSWINNRSSFIKSYFEGIKTPETASMKAGKEIHALIDAGIIKVQKIFDRNEETLSFEVGVANFLGIPDSFERRRPLAKVVSFVDYKTGKENLWKEKLPVDVKMRATAYLVWLASGKPELVQGFIEYIPTEWNPDSKTIIQVDGKETEIIKIMYSHDELHEFTATIEKVMAEVNEEYEKWLGSTSEFISNEDMDKYVDLRAKKEAIEAEMKEVGERIQGQMEFGHKSTVSTNTGTFYFTDRKTWDYPKDLVARTEDGDAYTLEEVEKIELAMKASQKKFEMENDPKSISRSFGFRAKK